jgi:hypothetical protein
MSDELYQFQRGDKKWHYNNGLDSILFGVDRYLPEIISYDRVNITNDVFRATIDLTMPISNPVIVDAFNNFSCNSITLRIWREESCWWMGRISRTTIKNDSAVLTCESIYSAMKRLGIRSTYERLCRYSIYDNNCGVDRASFTLEDQTVTEVNGNDITIPGIPAGDSLYKLGIIKKGSENTMILSRTGDVFTIIRNIGIVASDIVDISYGCARTIDDCGNKFSNYDGSNNLKHGGFPFMPKIDIFEVGIA